ncbi:MAG: hypothetical protein GF334_02310 [Candidatus Altiarchaeales archaeon]|nr:hypothetical protein [Candidatus Altiarchaeales archaeon]
MGIDGYEKGYVLWCLFFGFYNHVVVFGGLFAEKLIWRQIESANYCETDSHCVLAYYDCPFGCGVYINKDETAKLSVITEVYDFLTPVDCVYGCINQPIPECLSGRCAARVCEKDVFISQRIMVDGVYRRPCECPSDSDYEFNETHFRCVDRR